MAIIDNIKKALGFGPDEVELEAMPGVEIAESAEAQANTEAVADESDEMVSQIFGRVVEVFNKALPDFISASIDTDKQCKALYQLLDDSHKEYLLSLEKSVQKKFQDTWDEERRKLIDEAEELKKKAKKLENKRQELNDRQLSTDRQKRALSDRVHDLEAMVLKLESEKEQLDIENKCMINKAKAAGVLEAELEELRSKLSAGESADDTGADHAEKEKLVAEIDDKSQEIARLESELKESRETIDSMQTSLDEKNEENEQLHAEIAEKSAALDDNKIANEEIEKIQQQICLFEDVKQKMDTRYEKLKENLKNAQAENESLRETIKENLNRHSKEVDELKDKIRSLEAKLEAKLEESQEDGVDLDLAAEPETEYDFKIEKKSKKRKSVETPSDIDDLMSGSDWLVSAPTEPVSMRPLEENSDFGYQPPQRKPKMYDNDSLPSLFDF